MFLITVSWWILKFREFSLLSTHFVDVIMYVTQLFKIQLLLSLPC